MEQGELTALLRSWKPGDAVSEARLFPVIYPLLHALAKRELGREHESRTLGPTELLHEAYLRLASDWSLEVGDRQHFFAVAARVMRRVLIDRFRARLADKRGGQQRPVRLDDVVGEQVDLTAETAQSWVLVDDLLRQLEAEDSQTAQVAELKIFSGLENEDIAGSIGVSVPTVVRRWRFARSWLAVQLGGGQSLEPTATP